jgi:hypothetical protein
MITANPALVPTTTNAEVDRPRSAREMTARVVLAADLPMPVRISFQGEGVAEPGTSIMCLSLRTVAHGQAWSRYLGGRTDTYVHTGRVFLDEGRITWHGWTVHLLAVDGLSADPALDPATITALAASTGGAR